MSAPIVGSTVYQRSYIADQHREPDRWSFEAQLAFLVSKFEETRRHAEVNEVTVVDRDLREESEIFARYWYEKGQFDERAFETYLRCVDAITATAPAPNLIVFCSCRPETCFARIEARERSTPRMSIKDLRKLDELANEWKARQESPVVEVDTESTDVRKPAGRRLLLERLAEQVPTDQLSFFDLPKPASAPFGQDISWSLRERLTQAARRRSVSSGLRIYLAAPFTSVATEANEDGETLFEPDTPHGVLPRAYRDTLNWLSREVRRSGFDVILPHRDINRWGDTALLPETAARAIDESVRRCDAFLGVVGQSFGCHLEAGLALALRKPMVIISLEGIDDSFLIQGLIEGGRAAHVAAKDVEDLRSQLTRDRLRALIDEAVSAVNNAAESASIFGEISRW